MDFFSEEFISQMYNEKIKFKSTRGIDGLNARKFEKLYPNYAEKISTDIKNNTYKFSPYLEKLILKGRDKYPRVISIPCIRDQITLACLAEFIKDQYEDFLEPKMANSLIKRIKETLFHETQEICFFKSDFKNFYPSISHEILFEKLCLIENKKIIDLIKTAINNITRPYNSSNNFSASIKHIGIPQGLSISNILAEIYLIDLDYSLLNKFHYYGRYVDDILIISKNEDFDIQKIVETETKKLKITHSPEKTLICDENECINFLGYSIQKNTISVDEKNIQRYFQKLQSVFSNFKHNTNNLGKTTAEIVFVETLNIYISGAISDTKKYGWIVYYSELNDLTILYRIDSTIKKRLDKYNLTHLKVKIKSIVRSYFMIKERRWSEYAHNFDGKTITEMIDILSLRKLIEKDENLTEDEITHRYKKYVSSIIRKIDKDADKAYK